MKTNLSKINPDKFSVREFDFYGEKLYLVTPHYNGVQWLEDELIYRSSVWNSDGELVSAGFRKFFNLTEREDLVKSPDSLKNTVAVEKIDGSLLIFSHYHGQLIIRTRGTLNAISQMENGAEISLLLDKYKNIQQHLISNAEWNATGYYCPVSLLFEWVTPTNQIVIKYPEPDLYLVGGIYHHDYSYMSQPQLDKLAALLGVKRPITWNFNNKLDLLNTVKSWKDQEGICLYFNNGQDIKKIKSDDYLMKHALKADMTLDNILKLFINWGCPNYNDFVDKFTNTYDYEILQMAQGHISRIVDTYKEFLNIYYHMYKFVKNASNLPTRRKQAQVIIGAYGKGTIRQGMAFLLLDNKEIPPDMISKIMTQLLDK